MNTLISGVHWTIVSKYVGVLLLECLMLCFLQVLFLSRNPGLIVAVKSGHALIAFDKATTDKQFCCWRNVFLYQISLLSIKSVRITGVYSLDTNSSWGCKPCSAKCYQLCCSHRLFWMFKSYQLCIFCVLRNVILAPI